MKKFGYKKRVIRSLLLFVSLYSMGMLGMEKDECKSFPIVCDVRLLRPEKIVTIFNPKKELNIGRSWHEVIPGNMMITPDNRGVVFGVRGQVLYSAFDKEDDREPRRIIKHSDVKHSPLIAMAKKEDETLLIISAGNYKNSENKSVAEYIIYSSSHGYSKMHELQWPIQAISLDSTGETLAIAGLYDVWVIDFALNKHGSAVYKRKFRSEDCWIKDIAMKPEGGAVITVGNQNHEAIQWMNLRKDNDKDDNIDFKNLKQVDSNDVIEKIFYPSEEEFFYLTRDGKAKMFSFDALLINNGESLSTISFVDSSPYDIVVGDLSEQVATAHWTNNLKFPENKRNKIEIYRKDKKNRCIDKFILDVPCLEERYIYITPLGQRSSGIGHLLNVALRGRHVVALGSDGKMRLWQLPEKNALYEQLDKKEEQVQNEKLAEDKLNELKAASRPLSETRRSRSGSANSGSKRISISDPMMTTKTSDGEKPKKKSPRLYDDIIKVFSKENSRESSPSTSPGRENDNIKPKSDSAPLMNNNNNNNPKKEFKISG